MVPNALPHHAHAKRRRMPAILWTCRFSRRYVRSLKTTQVGGNGGGRSIYGHLMRRDNLTLFRVNSNPARPQTDSLGMPYISHAYPGHCPTFLLPHFDPAACSDSRWFPAVPVSLFPAVPMSASSYIPKTSPKQPIQPNCQTSRRPTRPPRTA